MTHGEIYCITNNINKKMYIGQAISFSTNGRKRGARQRWLDHCNRAKNHVDECRLLESAIRKYREELQYEHNDLDFGLDDVECVDIEDILSEICNKDPEAEIYIKCDIEGSEFVVLPRIIESEYVHHIKEMYIEWHERFWYGTSDYIKKIIEKESILNRFRELNIETFVHT
jgi:hypothetical protein